MFLALSLICIQKFSNWHGPFVFKSHSVAVVALSGVSHVACKAPDDSFSVFLSPSKKEPLRPPNNKNIIF